jgi:hypothetical protein
MPTVARRYRALRVRAARRRARRRARDGGSLHAAWAATLGAVFELVEKIEADLARARGRDALEHVREGLARLADAIDPTGCVRRGR